VRRARTFICATIPVLRASRRLDAPAKYYLLLVNNNNKKAETQKEKEEEIGGRDSGAAKSSRYVSRAWTTAFYRAVTSAQMRSCYPKRQCARALFVYFYIYFLW